MKTLFNSHNFEAGIYALVGMIFISGIILFIIEKPFITLCIVLFIFSIFVLGRYTIHIIYYFKYERKNLKD